MKTITIFLMLAFLTNCTHNTQDAPQTEKTPHTAVTLTQVSWGKIQNEIVLSATTAYLDKSIITAPFLHLSRMSMCNLVV